MWTGYVLNLNNNSVTPRGLSRRSVAEAEGGVLFFYHFVLVSLYLNIPLKTLSSVSPIHSLCASPPLVGRNPCFS